MMPEQRQGRSGRMIFQGNGRQGMASTGQAGFEWIVGGKRTVLQEFKEKQGVCVCTG